MRLSGFYVPTVKHVSTDVVAASHRYSIRAGLISQTASGIYTWLPLGLLVLKKIEEIVRQEMDYIGFSELLMPSLQPADLWKESNRYDSYGVEMLRVKDRHNREMVFGPTHEEVVTDLVRTSLSSYRDLPINLYQIQWKFRDELRPRHGALRGREFLMMDGYSFDVGYEEALKTYNAVFKAYRRAFKRMELPTLAVKAATGPIGGNMSHEFHILAPTGESTVYYDARALELSEKDDHGIEQLDSVYAVADEEHNPESCGIAEADIQVTKGIEAGHIFYLADRYSKLMNAKFCNADGVSYTDAKMGCYGIGISRLVAAIIEVYHDDAGIKWPESVAPFKVGIVNLLHKNEECKKVSEHLHSALVNDSLYDDKDDTAGVKLSRMDLLGLPWQIIVGNSFTKNGLLELKRRSDGRVETMSVDDVIARFS
ncbi:proline--tRNA ligase [Candidatus Anaplasma sp. TIGMIC]|uniref:proline--tRNA ligase n=1 Tax=Candidatus Anaplasma sp. TIGMIC TaxID=3020713 RepID=UPI00232D5DD5|nr:proline--tRNA ligase [Candidatus Anaplasma sp. TIGMIC]MDB1135692.1 proline--tRNA ligase [Candidatus Anaplasma sp. TIGMIC]